MRKTICKGIDRNWLERKVQIEKCLMNRYRKQKILSVFVNDIKIAGKKQKLAPMWKKLMKDVDFEEPTSFLDHVYLGMHSTGMQTKGEKLLDTTTRCLNLVFPAGATENYQDGTNLE